MTDQVQGEAIPPSFLRLLRCPKDAAELAATSGALTCTKCSTAFPIVDGIPRFVESDKYVGSFSFEWITHELTQIDDPSGQSKDPNESEMILRGAFGLTPEFVKDKWVLDAGCGAGRFTEVLSRWGANVVSVDLSRAVEACKRNVAGRPNVVVLQADIFSLPLTSQAFDMVYSNGVLHHSMDTREAFRSVCRTLKDGGYGTIYVYSDYGNNRWLDFWRRFTPKVPSKVLHTLCRLAVPAYHLRKVPGLGTALYKFVPMSNHKDAEQRILLTFDLYSPKYRFRHTYPEVYAWFVEEGFRDIKLFETQVIVGGFMDRAHAHRRPDAPTEQPSLIPLTTDRQDRAYLEGRRGLD